MWQQLFVSFLASAGFGVLFSVPRRFLVQCGVVGMAGWLLYLTLQNAGVTSIPATLVAAFGVTILSRVAAQASKVPVTLFSAPGIIPLVPGGLAYDAMRSFVNNDYTTALQAAAKVFLISGSIAMGLMLAEVLVQLLTRRRGAV